MIRGSAAIAGCACAAAALLAAAPARAHRFNDEVEVYGYTQVWATVWEQMEDANGLFQQVSGDGPADTVSGFSLARVRVGVRLANPDWNLSLHAQAKLDHDFGLLDADAAWTPRSWFSLHVGQFKVPGTFEALTEDRELDFIVRTDLTTALADYSLSKAWHPVSLLYGSVSNLRDLGVAAKGDVPVGPLAARYYAMVGNGLGANMYFGGLTKKEYLITNRGQFYWGGRVELAVPDWATLGLFGSRNRHDNVVFNSGRAILDINRRALGGDLRFGVPGTGARVGAVLGKGDILDDDNDGKVDLRYSGWAAYAVWDVYPLVGALAGCRTPEAHALELAVRYETMKTEVSQSGIPASRRRTTLGLNYLAGRAIKLQLNYVLRHGDDPAAVAPDLANDAVIANLQAAF